MRPQFVDCFVLIGTALSLNNDKLPQTNPPLLNDADATTVNISLSIEEISFTNLDTMETEITLLIHERWLDPRLSAAIRIQKLAVARQIWHPKITIVKGRLAACANNEDTQFWRGFGDEGNVLFSEKLTIKTHCTKDFKKFPFDSQICELKFGSYRFPIDEVQLMWDLNPAEVFTGIELYDFFLTNVSTFHEIDIRPTGNYSVLVIQFAVKRHFQHYIVCTMSPCVTLLLLSYCSFWIDQNSVGFRLLLSLSATLFLICLYVATACTTSKAPYLKALDIFIILCILFANFSLFENCLISYMYSQTYVNFTEKTQEIYAKVISWVEFFVRIAYPIFYITFLIIFLYCVL